MAVKTQISDTTFQLIIPQYNLGDFNASDPIPQGTVQTNYLIHTTQGTYIFRYYENRSFESVLFETGLLNYLKQQDYPCPGLFPNKGGKMVAEYQGKPYVIFEFLGGQPIEQLEWHHKAQVIEQAARLQALTQTYQPKYPDHRLNYNPGNCRALAAEVSREINTADSGDKLTWLEDQLNQLDLPELLPRGICHCDFHFSNLLFQDDQFSGLIDFDDANTTYLSFDLVCLIDTWAWPHTSDRLNWTHAREIAQAYLQYRPLSPLEVRHLIEVHKLSIFFDCIWFFGRGTAANFYEKRKTEFLDQVGWEEYNHRLFG